MKAYPYVVGRGQYTGFGFFATANGIPYNAPWIGALQASDTLEHRPIIEMHCVAYAQPVLMSSQWVAEGTPFGYTEYLELELPEEEQQRQTFFDQPARMLYLDFMDTKTFLSLDREHGPGHETLEVQTVQLPKPPDHAMLDAKPELMAALLVDVWANSFQRLLGADISPLRLELTPLERGRDTLDDGRAFIHQQLLPLLPPSVRHIISVRIGCFWSTVKRGAGSAALVISLPEKGSWSMKGGYNLNTNTYQFRSPSDWSDFGEALLQNTHLEYYWDLHNAAEYQPIAADFEVAYLLFRVHKQLHGGTLTEHALNEATRLWFRIDKLIAQGYKDITITQRRNILFRLECDIVHLYTRVTNVQFTLNAYDALITHAFSIHTELLAGKHADASQALQNEYIQILVSPKTINDWAYLPCARLWMIESLYTKYQRNDPELFIQLADRCLKEHGRARPLPWEQLNGLLHVYKTMEAPWQQSLGTVLANYAGSGVANGFLITDVQGVREALAEVQPEIAHEVDAAAAQQFERVLLSREDQTDRLNRFKSFGMRLPPDDNQRFFSYLREKICRIMEKQQSEETISMQKYLKICDLFNWLQCRDIQHAMLFTLKRRGLDGGCYLAKDEVTALVAILANADDTLKQCVMQAISPMAANTTPDSDMVVILGNLLPYLIASPIQQPLTGGWQLAYNKRMLEALSGVMKQAYGDPKVLVKPHEAWENASPFTWLKLESLDELTNWYLDPSDLVACVENSLIRSLEDSTTPALLAGVTPSSITAGWFGSLLQKHLRSLLSSDRISYYLEGCINYRQLSALEALCNALVVPQIHTDLRGALAYVVNREGKRTQALLDAYHRLRRKEIAGELINILTGGNDQNPWNSQCWDDILLVAYITKISCVPDHSIGINNFLHAIGVDREQLSSLNPWDKDEGTHMLSILLYSFYWFDDMKLNSIAETLRRELSQEKRFVRRLRSKGDLRRIFAPVMMDRQRESDPRFPSSLRNFLIN